MREGDRVSTPDGPGTIVSFWHSWERMRRRVDIGVQLDAEGGQWRKLYRPTDLQPDEHSTRAAYEPEVEL